MNFKQAHSSNFRVGRISPIKYLVIHYTSNNGDTAKNNIDYYARTPNLSASAHYYVDENEIWQSVLEKDTAWHCGASTYKHNECRNSNSIGIELCSRYTGNLTADKKANTVDFNKYYFKDAVIERAVTLTKELMAKYNIPISNVIRHYDVTGKTCPAPMVNDTKQWQAFLNKLSAPKKKIESGNDIVWALMNGGYNVEINEVAKAVKAVDKAKTSDEFHSLYWILYKIVNK